MKAIFGFLRPCLLIINLIYKKMAMIFANRVEVVSLQSDKMAEILIDIISYRDNVFYSKLIDDFYSEFTIKNFE